MVATAKDLCLQSLISSITSNNIKSIYEGVYDKPRLCLNESAKLLSRDRALASGRRLSIDGILKGLAKVFMTPRAYLPRNGGRFSHGRCGDIEHQGCLYKNGDGEVVRGK